VIIEMLSLVTMIASASASMPKTCLPLSCRSAPNPWWPGGLLGAAARLSDAPCGPAEPMITAADSPSVLSLEYGWPACAGAERCAITLGKAPGNARSLADQARDERQRELKEKRDREHRDHQILIGPQHVRDDQLPMPASREQMP
jgi:hypothetical protein